MWENKIIPWALNKLSKRSQAKLTTFIWQQRTSKQRENNRKSERQGATERERQRDRMLLCQQLFVWVCYSMAKRPDWVMKSRTALNINEFSLFGMSGSPWRNLYQAYTRFDYFQQQKCCTLPTLFPSLWHHNYDALDEVLASSLCQCLPVKEKVSHKDSANQKCLFSETLVPHSLHD